jgi:hypothetical protein
VARKKNPVHLSTYARLGIVGINAILYGTHLTTDPDINTQATVSYRTYSNTTPLYRKLSIVFTRCPRHVMELESHEAPFC